MESKTETILANGETHPQIIKAVHNGSFVTGFHPGQNNDPEKVYDAIKTESNHVLFRISSQEQFATNWECWVREEDQ